MNRDGLTDSIWQQNTPDYQSQNGWNKQQIYDILIVGGGVTGLTAAYLLQEAGQRCILIDAHNIGFGTTGGTTAHLNTILDTPYEQIIEDFGLTSAKLVANATREAIDLVNGLNTKLSLNCDFRYETGYVYATTPQEDKQLANMLEASRQVGIVSSFSSQMPLNTAFTSAARFEFQAAFHPTKYITGLAAAFESLGGVIMQQCQFTALTEEGAYNIAATTLGNIQAAQVIYATHIPPGINILHFRCAPYRSYVQAFTLKSGQYPEGLIYDLQRPYNYYRTHVLAGERFVIAGGFDHKTGHEANTSQVFTAQEAYYRKLFDIGRVAWTWSSQYYTNTDGLPYIGKLPGQDRIFTGTGYDGNGMIWGVFAGKMLCELIIRGNSPYEDVFRPSRVKPIAGFADFIRENADVVSQFVGKRFAFDDLNDLVALAPGEALLANWQNQKVALYKDDNGKLLAVDPVCPHAKCIVSWNAAEKSWDCPCHGARYAPNGALLTGPARTGLTPIVWDNAFSGE